jgi:PAS domain S-box-containing protein
MAVTIAESFELLQQAELDAMNELGVLYFVKDHERRFVLCTDALVHHLGYRNPRQVIGLRDEDLSPPHLVDHYRSYDERILQHGERIVELVELVRSVNGSFDWFATTKWPLRQGRSIVGLAGVIRSLRPAHSVGEGLLPLTPAIELMAEAYQRRLSIEELAEAAGMSPSYFNRQFKKHFGTTPHRYLRSVRLMAVDELLCTTELPLSAIAHQTGFYDQSHLSNEFSRHHGVTPLEYRRHNRAGIRLPPGPRQVKLRLDVPR